MPFPTPSSKPTGSKNQGPLKNMTEGRVTSTQNLQYPVYEQEFPDMQINTQQKCIPWSQMVNLADK